MVISGDRRSSHAPSRVGVLGTVAACGSACEGQRRHVCLCVEARDRLVVGDFSPVGSLGSNDSGGVSMRCGS